MATLCMVSNFFSYLVRHLSPETGHEFDDNDQRWNKVEIVRQALDVGGWASDLDYVAFMDSDLVVLNPEMWRLEDIIASAPPDAEVLFSRDSEPLNGLMNRCHPLTPAHQPSPWILTPDNLSMHLFTHHSSHQWILHCAALTVDTLFPHEMVGHLGNS